MTTKILRVGLLVLLLGIFAVGCSDIIPSKMPINDSIKESLNSKEENFDFSNDESFLELVDEYVNSLQDVDRQVQYTIGNLNDKDNIPELVVFMDRNPDMLDSKVELVVYEFNGDSYVIVDRIDMNHDTSNHLMEIGNISPNQKGIFLSNNVGAHSTITYGFILEDGNLKSILNENRVSLISLESENDIRDIDNDGILEFSIYTVDPEADRNSDNGHDKMTIWYKWDGKDGGNVVMTESKSSDVDQFKLDNILTSYSRMPMDQVLADLDQNLEDYNAYKTSRILKEYVQRLEGNFQNINQSPYLNRLLEDKNKFNLSIDKLNDKAYISRDNTLDQDIRDFILENIRLGYKLVETEGSFYFIIDNQFFIDSYQAYISREYLSYLEIKAFNSNEPYLKDGAFIIDRASLAKRIVAIENFKLRFPYSKFITEINSIYSEYIRTFILGSVNSPNYDQKTNEFSSGSISLFKMAINDNPNTHFADILEFVIDKLNSNSNVISPDIKEDIEEKI